MVRDRCYYDGWCGRCRRTIRVLKALDWLERLDIRDMTAVPESELPVSMDVALTGMPMRTADGRILVGFKAIRRALAQTAGAPVAWFMYLPGVSQVGERVYNFVARTRRRVCPVR
jgi:predicted DCC family thiol-disulfide oxidoreductase YuxK